MHKILKDKSKRAIVASLSGNIGLDHAKSMLSDFKSTVQDIKPVDYILIINPENISASLFVLPILQSFIQMVSLLDFKKIYLINSGNYAAIIKQSLSSYGIADKIRYSASIDEALNSR